MLLQIRQWFGQLRLGFYLTSSIKRWTTCIDGFLSLFEVIRALQMQLHALGVSRQNIDPQLTEMTFAEFTFQRIISAQFAF